MNSMKIENNIVRYQDIEIKTPYDVIASLLYYPNELIVVLMDWRKNVNDIKHFENLLAYDKKGNLTWIAELPTNSDPDCYVEAQEKDGFLVARSWSCFSCIIDPYSGKISDRHFTK